MSEEAKKTINQHFFPELYCINYEKLDEAYGIQMPAFKNPLMEAVCANNMKDAYFYIKTFEKDGILEHSDPAMHNETPLVEAIFRHYNQMAFFLMQMGANPNNRAKGYFSPLEAAICANNSEMIQGLMPVADLKQQNLEGDHPLLFACLKGNTLTVREILKREPSVVNQTNTIGLSPLMVAAHQGYEDIVRILLGYKAHPAYMLHGRTAADYAKSNGHMKLASKLRTVSIGTHADPFRLKRDSLQTAHARC